MDLVAGWPVVDEGEVPVVSGVSQCSALAGPALNVSNHSDMYRQDFVTGDIPSKPASEASRQPVHANLAQGIPACCCRKCSCWPQGIKLTT